MASSTSQSPAVAKSRRKQTKFRGGEFSLYEAVAGRITTGEKWAIKRARALGIITESQILGNAHRRRVAPEDVLFRRSRAPTRYAEHDIYWAHERELPEGGRGPNKPVLPEGDLLKAMHGYTCRFYEAMGWRIYARKKGKEAASEAPPAGEETKTLAGRLIDEKSMDGTALLAFGILFEEAGRSALGKTGDLAFVEAEGGDEKEEEEEEEEEERKFPRDQVVPREPALGISESTAHNHSLSQARDAEDTQADEEMRPKKKKRRRH